MPSEMRELPRWVAWAPDKTPRQLNGRLASSTDERTWDSWGKVSAGSSRRGFVLNGDGIVCIDLDHCVTDGVVQDWAHEIVDACASYTEVSASGTGLHIFGYAHVERGRKIRDGRSIEVYGAGRYIAITGTRYCAAPIRLTDISAHLPI